MAKWHDGICVLKWLITLCQNFWLLNHWYDLDQFLFNDFDNQFSVRSIRHRLFGRREGRSRRVVRRRHRDVQDTGKTTLGSFVFKTLTFSKYSLPDNNLLAFSVLPINYFFIATGPSSKICHLRIFNESYSASFVFFQSFQSSLQFYNKQMWKITHIAYLALGFELTTSWCESPRITTRPGFLPSH